ncbi:MAG: HAD-IA family hydrolase [Actinomycetota bacterium]|nr:HAD-IA family hydrolase [Actinomycetota bacterium]
MRYRAVFFDAGGTLIDPDPTFTELLARILTEEGHPVDPERVVEGLPAVADVFLQAAKDRELWTTSDQRSRLFWGRFYRLLLGELGISEDELERLGDRLYAVFTDPSSYHLLPDAPAVLDKLRDAGAILGLVSNFEAWLERLLEHLDVARYFPVRVISGVEGVEKPDPEIFRIALDRAGVSAGESVYVGDNPVFDALPAEEAGMAAVIVDRWNRFPEYEGTRIGSLDELPGVLEL